MKNNKGFSLIEFLVVVALIGVLSIFLYTPKTSRWNTEVSSSQSQIVSLLKYYQKKSIRDGYKYYVRLENDSGQKNMFQMQAHIDKNITSRQSTCTPSNDTGFSERRVFDPLRNIRVVSCESGGKKCKNTSTGNMGICFFPNGSSASTGDRKEWYIFHSAGNKTTHAKKAYKFTIWKTTSFFETFVCKEATYANMASASLTCSNWVNE